MSTLLRVEGIEVGYGDLTAVRDVSLEVREGEAVALIGANGAGKTTTLCAVSGLLPLRRGRIELDGRPIHGLRPAEIVARGTAARGWLEIAPADPPAQAAMLQCLHVAGVPRAHLQAAGIDDARRPGAIGFSDRFGFYLIAQPPPQ